MYDQWQSVLKAKCSVVFLLECMTSHVDAIAWLPSKGSSGQTSATVQSQMHVWYTCCSNTRLSTGLRSRLLGSRYEMLVGPFSRRAEFFCSLEIVHFLFIKHCNFKSCFTISRTDILKSLISHNLTKIVLWVPLHFLDLIPAHYSAPQCSHCKRCTSYSNSVCPSVCLSACLSVRPSVTRPYCVKTTARSTVQFALSDSKMHLVL